MLRREVTSEEIGKEDPNRTEKLRPKPKQTADLPRRIEPGQIGRKQADQCCAERDYFRFA